MEAVLKKFKDLTPDEKQEIITLYKTRRPVTEVAYNKQVSVDLVIKVLREAKVSIRGIKHSRSPQW